MWATGTVAARDLTDASMVVGFGQVRDIWPSGDSLILTSEFGETRTVLADEDVAVETWV